jgi:hypothetical protein
MGWPKRSHTVWHISGSSLIRRVAGIPVFLNGNSIRIIFSIRFVLRNQGAAIRRCVIAQTLTYYGFGRSAIVVVAWQQNSVTGYFDPGLPAHFLSFQYHQLSFSGS